MCRYQSKAKIRTESFESFIVAQKFYTLNLTFLKYGAHNRKNKGTTYYIAYTQGVSLAKYAGDRPPTFA